MVTRDQEPGLIGRYSSNGYYDQRFIKQVVQEVEKGLPRKAACIQYGLKKDTLHYWMRKFGSAAYKQTLNRPFTATTKRSVVRAVTEGKLSIKEAQAAYGIKGQQTINNWIKQENAELSVITSSMADTNKQNESSSPNLQLANDALKKQLEEAQLKIAALNTLIDVAEEQLKINIRKKPGAKQS